MKKIFKIMLITTILMTLLLSLPANVFSGELGDGLGELGISYDKKWSSLGDDLPARESYVVGDVNVDEKVSIKDVTLIQKFLADIESMTYNGYYNADVDNDGKLTITDATCIQKKLAGIIDRFPLEEVLYPVKNLSLNKSEAMHVTVGYEGTFIFNCEKEGIYRLKISDDDCMIILYNEQGEALRAFSGGSTSSFHGAMLECYLTPGEYKYIVNCTESGNTRAEVYLEEVPYEYMSFDVSDYTDLPLGSDFSITNQETMATVYKVTIDGTRDDIGYLDVFVEDSTIVYIFDTKGCFISCKDYLEYNRNSFGFAFHLSTAQEFFVVVYRYPDIDNTLDNCTVQYDTYTNYYFKDAEALTGEVLSEFYYESAFTEYDDGVYGYKFTPSKDGYYKFSVDTHNPQNSTVFDYYSSITLFDSTVFDSGLGASLIWASEANNNTGTSLTEYLYAGETYYLMFAGYTVSGQRDVKFSVSEGTKADYESSHKEEYSYIALGDNVEVSFAQQNDYKLFLLNAEEDMDIVIRSKGGNPYVAVMNAMGESVLLSDNISETNSDFAIRGKLTAGDSYYIMVGCFEDTSATTVSVIPYSEYR